jgi:hypothetical protein
MHDVSHELERLAEADGATFSRSPGGAWSAKGRDGVFVVRGALSRGEAARLYCEDRDLVASTPESILARICAEYRPYDAMPSFREGFDAYGKDGAHRLNPYGSDVDGQAWDRGANAAMFYARAMQHLETNKEDVEKAGPGWLSRLLRTGRC